MKWLDPERILTEVEWHGCSETAVTPVNTEQLALTEATMDTFANAWGFAGTTPAPIQWFILDTGLCPP